MRNKLAQILVILLIILSIASIVSNSVVFNNMRAQQIVIEDFGNLTPKMELKKALELDFSYPNINAYTVPFKTYIGKVLLRDSLYEEAISYFHEARKHNPYLRVNENYLAEIYDILGVKDSFNYYSNLTFMKMPNNPIHFGRYIKSIGPHQNTFIIDSLFNKQKYKYEVFWQLYLSMLVGIENKSELAHSNFSEALRTFPKGIEIEMLVDYNLYGKYEVDAAKEISNVADNLAIKGDFKNAIVLLEKAIKKHPFNDYFEKLATIYFKKKDYEKAFSYLEKFDLDRTFNEPRFNLIKGVTLCELNNEEEGCKFLTRALILKDPQAKKAKEVYCN